MQELQHTSIASSQQLSDCGTTQQLLWHLFHSAVFVSAWQSLSWTSYYCFYPCFIYASRCTKFHHCL